MARKRSPHPGLTVIPADPDARRAESVKWKDPVTGKWKTEKIPELPPLARMRWLKKKSLALQAAKLDSRPPPAGMPVGDAADLYFDEVRIADQTVVSYERSVKLFLEWAKPPISTADLDLVTLRRFRAHLNRPSWSPETVNFHLRQLAPMLRHWRKAGLTPRLVDQDISDGLELFKSTPEKKIPLSRDQIRALVLALGGHGDKDEGAGTPDRLRAFVLSLLLGGFRPGEAFKLRGEMVSPEGVDLPGWITKNKRPRHISFDVSPSLRKIMTVRGANEKVFTFRRSVAQKLAKRVDVPFSWTFQQLRVTCAAYLTSAPGIYGGASAYMSAARLGHSVRVAESNYLSPVGIPPEARTLEQAMDIADLLP